MYTILQRMLNSQGLRKTEQAKSHYKLNISNVKLIALLKANSYFLDNHKTVLKYSICDFVKDFSSVS